VDRRLGGVLSKIAVGSGDTARIMRRGRDDSPTIDPDPFLALLTFARHTSVRQPGGPTISEPERGRRMSSHRVLTDSRSIAHLSPNP
jgi:hypothetical protein